MTDLNYHSAYRIMRICKFSDSGTRGKGKEGREGVVAKYLFACSFICCFVSITDAHVFVFTLLTTHEVPSYIILVVFVCLSVCLLTSVLYRDCINLCENKMVTTKMIN